LSAALDFGFDFDFAGAAVKIKVKIKVKSSGQKCPLHINIEVAPLPVRDQPFGYILLVRVGRTIRHGASVYLSAILAAS
jgi:hypothetical protein